MDVFQAAEVGCSAADIMEDMVLEHTATVAILVDPTVIHALRPAAVQLESALLGTELIAASFGSTCSVEFDGFDSKIRLNMHPVQLTTSTVTNLPTSSTEMGLPTTYLDSSLDRWQTGAREPASTFLQVQVSVFSETT